jgi:hypothetical protein
MSTWEQLDTYLDGLTRRLGGAAYVFSDSGKLQLSPPGDLSKTLAPRFEGAVVTLRELFGKDCLKNGHWKRHLHHQDENWFIAEPVLSAYHLIVLLTEDYSADDWMKHVLDQARPILADIIARLPPLDGGRRAVPVEQSPS